MLTQEKITKVLRHFKNKRWELSGQRNDAFQSSEFISDADVKADVQSHSSKLMLRFNYLPKGMDFKSGISMVKQAVESLLFRLYPNTRFTSLATETGTTKGSVPILFVDGEKKTYDIRKPGHSLSKAFIKANINKEIWLHSYTGIARYDGLPTAAGTTLVIKIPQSVLDTRNESEVHAAVTKYIAAGIMPIIQFY